MTQTKFQKFDVEQKLKEIPLANKIKLLGGKVRRRFGPSSSPAALTHELQLGLLVL